MKLYQIKSGYRFFRHFYNSYLQYAKFTVNSVNIFVNINMNKMLDSVILACFQAIRNGYHVGLFRIFSLPFWNKTDILKEKLLSQTCLNELTSFNRDNFFFVFVSNSISSRRFCLWKKTDCNSDLIVKQL